MRNSHCSSMNVSEDNEESYELQIAQEFIEELSKIYSDRLLNRIRHTLSFLGSFPGIGSTQVCPVLTKIYGEGIRKIPVSIFTIIYRVNNQTVEVLALVPGPKVL